MNSLIQLALETSSRNASVCLARGKKVLDQVDLDSSSVTTQTILPAIQSLLHRYDLTAQLVEQVSVSIGPGSFTGLRLGITAAKTFSFATGCKVFQCDTHAILAAQALESADRNPNEIPIVATVINAQRGEWFAATHELSVEANFNPESDAEKTAMRKSSISKVVKPQEFFDSLVDDSQVLIAGNALERMPKNISVPKNFVVAEESAWTPTAGTLSRLAVERPAVGKLVDAMLLMPDYGRRSAAEEKWLEKQNANS